MIVSDQWPSYSKQWGPVSVVINTAPHAVPSGFQDARWDHIMKLLKRYKYWNRGQWELSSAIYQIYVNPIFGEPMKCEFKMSDPFYSIIGWVNRLISIVLMGSTFLLFSLPISEFQTQGVDCSCRRLFQWCVVSVGELGSCHFFCLQWQPKSRASFQRRSSTVVRPIHDAFVCSGLFLLMLPITWSVTKICRRPASEWITLYNFMDTSNNLRIWGVALNSL